MATLTILRLCRLCFGDALTQSSSDHNLVPVKLTQILVLAYFPDSNKSTMGTKCSPAP